MCERKGYLKGMMHISPSMLEQKQSNRDEIFSQIGAIPCGGSHSKMRRTNAKIMELIG